MYETERSTFSRSLTLEVLLWNNFELWLQLQLRHFYFNYFITSLNLCFTFDPHLYMLKSKMCGDKGKVRGHIMDWEQR